MRKVLPFLAALVLANVFPFFALSQNVTIRGNIKNATSKENVAAVSIIIKGTSEGTYTDDKGNFTLVTGQKLPFVIEASAIGFETQTLAINGAGDVVQVNMIPAAALGQDVVISANRMPSRLLESPVSIERVGNAAIRNSAAANYYDIVANLKGVDMISSSLTFKTPTTRGFAGSGNVRFNQIVVGMDNQAPGLNFSVGSIIGLSELDVESMELLQGASSALYGSGGMNGTLIINGKNPFKYQGLSFQVKEGFMDWENPTAYHNLNARWAQKVGEKFAYKIGVEYINAQDWQGDDYRNYKRFGTTGEIVAGTRTTDPNYDGINVYGDESTGNIKTVLNGIAGQAPFLKEFIDKLPANIPVSRTGYRESDVVNPTTFNLKLSGALHYKLTKTIEASLTAYWGNGNTVYTGSTRYSLLDLKMGQYKVELNHKNWFLKGYTTQENAGEAHNLTVTTQLVNEAWKKTVSRDGSGAPAPQLTDWIVQYSQAYLAQKLAGKTEQDAHNAARAVADQGRPLPRSDEFKRLYDDIRLKPIPQGGLLLDRSDLWVVEGQYNLTDIIKFAEVLVGANWKQYVLNSEGTLFADKTGEPIKINEYGAYVQISKNLFKEALRLTASGRYDKNQNFDGRFTPRITALFKPAKDHNIRLSFQTAYRFPSTQQQWIDLNTGNGRLLGSVKELWDKYNMTTNPVYSAESLAAGAPAVVPYTQSKPESVVSYEIGYKTLISKKLLVDVYGYWSQYTDFISRRDVGQQIDQSGGFALSNIQGYSVVTNAPGTVKAYGWGLSLEYLMPANFIVSGNVSSDILSDVPEGFRADFNSPKYRTNITLANTAFGEEKKLGASVTWRYQEGFFYQSDFATGDIPSVSTVDAQISYRMTKSVFKLGAANLLNSFYRNGVGNATIGGVYYLSYGYNIF
jgi:outer membrane receptor protein involved in Fe transport